MLLASSQPVLAMAAELSVPSFDEVYRAHFGFVWRVLKGMGVADGAVEDATQEVFLVVMRRLPELGPDAAIKSWLFSIALRVASNARRSRRRKRQEPLEAEPASAGPSPLQRTESRRALERVLAVLDTLDEPLRVVLVLSQLEQMTAPEISSLLGVNVNTVSSRLRRARKAFADEVERRRIGAT